MSVFGGIYFMDFSNKLSKRIKEKGLTTRELARQIYNFGSDSDLWYNLEPTKQNSKMKNIQRWISGECKPKTIDDLEKLCTILDCDSSYLLGDSTIENLNNYKVGEWLGLDGNVISNIKSYDNSIKYFMSLLVRANEIDNTFGDILLEFLKIMVIHADNSAYKTITIKDDMTEEIEELKGEKATNYIMSAVKNMMESVFYKVSIIGMEIGNKRYKNKCEEDEHKWKEEYEKLMKETMEISGKSREEILKNIELHNKK